MNIWKHLEHDHAELHSLGHDILKSSDGPDVGGRDNQFDLYDIQLRRHLALIEEVLFPELRKDERTQNQVSDLQARHKEVRKQLKQLDRNNKGSHEWTAEFRDFTDSFEKLSGQHENLAKQARTFLSDTRASELGDEYERAKIKRMQGGHFSWNRFPAMGSSSFGKAATIAGAAAAVAGAAYAANRYFSSGRRASGSSQDDFELRLETDENLRLISSTKVEGTSVIDRNGAKIGTIESFMVDKYTGRVAYAVMKFGGSFGFGASLFPLPWPVLDYDEEKDGYMLDITKEEMSNAPRFEASDTPEFSPEYRRRILVFYRPTPSRSGSPDSWNASSGNTSAGSSSRSAIGGGSSSSSGSNSQSTKASATKPIASPEPTSVG